MECSLVQRLPFNDRRPILGIYYPHSLIAQSFRRATAFTTSSQILLSRGVADLDLGQSDGLDPTSEAPLVTVLENASVHILYVGPSSTPEITRVAGDRATHSGMGDLELDSTKDPGPLAASYEADAPVRAKASPRSTPSDSVQSSFSFHIASERAGSPTLSSEEGSPIRGRTLVRVPTHKRREHRAMTRIQAGPNLDTLDSATMRVRFLSRDLTNEPDEMDGCYMEPLPFERFRASLSEELHKAATFNDSIDLTTFGGHRDTFAILGLRRMQIQGPELPSSFFQRFLDYINFDEYLAIRLSCRCWSAGITSARPVVMPSVCKIPAEILEKIYAYLSPVDLNAARHTCRAWMIGSLEEKLLTRVLKEGGWWRAAKADMDLHEEFNGHRTVDSVNEEWLLSKRLATECSLQSGWTGNGLSRNLSSSPTGGCNGTGIALTSETDFSELSTGYNPSRMGSSQHGSAVHFTVSVCCKFLLVTEGCLIYVYSLRDSACKFHLYGGHLSHVTTVVCPHRVLAVTMDTSSQRFAIAALLEDRVGLVCDFHEQTPSSTRKWSSPQVLSNIMRDCRTSVDSSVPSGEPIVTESTSPQEFATFRASPSNRALARAVAETSLPEVHGARNLRTPWQMDDPLVAAKPGPSGSFSTNTGYIPFETGIRSIYRNLCSAEDPPRSVAICPQRRCIAFGCSAGIELHWVDALTGHDLNRWFPLTAPSDFLYFLPPRIGVDSAKKLRLISSACHPNEKGGLVARFFPGASTGAAGLHGMAWDEELSDPRVWDNVWRGSGWCDHYRAVPISDGWNILFTDPVEGRLCLGTDAPPGAGATKLTRRFVFTGPTEFEKTVVPRVYAAGRELRWGVRVAVGYGEAIWLFSLPPDVFFGHQSKTGERQDEQATDADEEPIRIEGVNIGHMQGLVDLAIDASGGDLTILSFAVDGMAYAWQIVGQTQSVVRSIVLKDGTVTALEDADGDTYMFNTSQPAVHFDGAAPLRPMCAGATCPDPSTQPFIQNLFVDPYDRVIDHGRTVDRDGDIHMPDALPAEEEEDEGYASGEVDDEDEVAQAGHGAFTIYALPAVDRWSEGEDAGWVVDHLAQREGGVDVVRLSKVEVEVLCG